ncbi:MAG: polysaccharide biosynthesis tyrosine autokinase [Planctomycetota bacterium]|jgi:capsular exopolysaccharide synthesis family protein
MSDNNHNHSPSNGHPADNYSKIPAGAAGSSAYHSGGRNGEASGGETGGGMMVSLFANTVRRWWKMATPVALLSAVGICAYIFLTFQWEYRATAWLTTKRYEPTIVGGSARDFGGDPTGYIATQGQLIRSPMILSKASAKLKEEYDIKELEDQSDPENWLLTRLEARWDGHSLINTVSFTCGDPEDAKTIVNTIVDTYLQLRKEWDQRSADILIDILNREHLRHAEQVKALREQVSDQAALLKMNDPFSPPESSIVVGETPLANLHRQLVSTDLQRKMLEVRIKAAEQARKESGGKVKVSERDVDKALQSRGPIIVAKFMEKKAGERLDEYKSRLTPEGKAQLDRYLKVRTGFIKKVRTAFINKSPTFIASSPNAGINAIILGNPAILDVLMEPDAKDLSDLQSAPACRQYEELMARLASAKAELTKVKGNEREGITTELEETVRLSRDNELLNLKTSLESYNLLYGILEERYNEDLGRVSESTGDTLEYEVARAKLDRENQVFELIASRILTLRTELSAPDIIELKHAATVPTRPVNAIFGKGMVLGVLAALCIPFGLAVLWEFFARRVSSAEQIQSQTRLPVVAEIARLPVRARQQGRRTTKRMGYDLNVFEESIDSLRTSLVLAEPLRDMRVLTVTSPSNNEGKTSVSVQLAVSIARASGELTLLVDGDMRSPDVHRVLDVPAEPGLVKVLAGACGLEQAIITEWSKRVHLLPAGKLRGSPHRLLGDGAFRSVLDELRPTYRYIVIDSPPVLAASEALVLAKSADAALICSMRDVSRMDQLSATYERLRAAGARPVGVVLNGIPTRNYAYRYGSYTYVRDGGRES